MAKLPPTTITYPNGEKEIYYFECEEGITVSGFMYESEKAIQVQSEKGPKGFLKFEKKGITDGSNHAWDKAHIWNFYEYSQLGNTIKITRISTEDQGNEAEARKKAEGKKIPYMNARQAFALNLFTAQDGNYLPLPGMKFVEDPGPYINFAVVLENWAAPTGTPTPEPESPVPPPSPPEKDTTHKTPREDLDTAEVNEPVFSVEGDVITLRVPGQPKREIVVAGRRVFMEILLFIHLVEKIK